jgi:hypothetical protein
MNEQNFARQKQDAIRRMQQMNSKSAEKIPDIKPEPKQESYKQNSNSLLETLNIPFLSNLKKDGDATLILGILLLLLSEKADKKLLFALIYILL